MLGALDAERSLGQGGTHRPDLSGRPVGAPRSSSPDAATRQLLSKSQALIGKLRAALQKALEENASLRLEVDRVRGQLAQAQGAAQAAWRGRAARGEQPPIPDEAQASEGLSASEVLGDDYDDDGMGA